MVTTTTGTLRRYSTFHGTQLLASFTISLPCKLLKITAAAETMYFSTSDRTGHIDLLVTDCTGATVARHAVPWGQEDSYELHMSRDGSLLIPSLDHSELFVCSAAGALRSIPLHSEPSSHRAVACSSWGHLGVVMFGPQCELYFVDLLSGRSTGRQVMLGSQTLSDDRRLSPVQGRRSVAVPMGAAAKDEQLRVVSTSNGSVLFTLSGRRVCWDVLGDYLAGISASRTSVSVHHGLSGARIASWETQPGPDCFTHVLRLRWLPGSSALMCDRYSGPDFMLDSDYNSEQSERSEPPPPGERAHLEWSLLEFITTS